jgi:ring-1,2-phenylacetyl-CoA epoxidase subunit PaaC
MTAEVSDALGAVTRSAVRDLILALADTKRVLGYRYAEWMLGAPELETGIACSSMAQDEWGHARLLYALMKDFDEDVERLEHGRESESYHSMEVLDAPAETWPDVVALMVLADAAVTLQIGVLRDSSYAPLRQRVEKVLEEERFHAAHGAAWLRRLAGGTGESGAALAAALERTLEPVLGWFGPESERSRRLVEDRVVSEAGPALSERFIAQISPLLDEAGVSRGVTGAPDLANFDEGRRRSAAGGPDEETVRRVRGDRNRAFLMD